MTPVFAARRRAEEFAALVEAPSTSATDDARYSQLLELVGAMRAAPAPEARPEFVADLRARLMAEAETALVPEDTSRLTLPARRPARERRIAAAVGGFALVGATTSMAMAAQSALPGDALYPVKRAIENVHTGLSVGEAQKGSTLLDNASGRLDEATELSRGGDLEDSVVIADTLNDFTDQAAEASDLLLADYTQSGDQDSIDELRGFTASSLDRLTELEQLVPPEARDELMHAAQVVIAIDTAAQQACPSCDGGVTKIPPMFTASSTAFEVPTSHRAKDGKGGRHHGSKQHADDGSELPSVDAGDLPPGSVLDPTQDGGTGGQSGPTGDATNDPIGSLTEGLTGGGDGSGPGVPDVGGTVDDVTNDVGQLLDDATGSVTGGVTAP
ncbi:DUF5667 domain-containing protein [Nocardioides koreensis]|uniref:DUF5667 domain-containing protein n=1 Tax=Nocardioides koreensis TaxID=433651 RepID=A0ABP5LK24_9ACTN